MIRFFVRYFIVIFFIVMLLMKLLKKIACKALLMKAKTNVDKEFILRRKKEFIKAIVDFTSKKTTLLG